MLRKLGCLSLLITLTLVAAVAWLGYQAYVRISDARAVDTRMTEVATAWDGQTGPLETAGSGRAGVRPTTLDPTPWRGVTTTTTVAYQTTRAGVRLQILTGSCERYPWQIDVREEAQVVIVLPRRTTPWWPDPRGLFPQDCTAVAVPRSIDVTLASPRGDRVVVDAVTGGSVRRVASLPAP